MHTTLHTASPAPHPADPELAALRSGVFNPRRRRWPGVLAAALIGAGLAAVAVSSYYDERTIGERIDASVGAAEQSVRAGVEEVRSGASEVVHQGANVSGRVGTSLTDAGITAAVKTSLAADPVLSALKIEVDTIDGVVSLSGPAPDEKSRERAAVLAAAPPGVNRVDNRLAVSPGPAPATAGR